MTRLGGAANSTPQAPDAIVNDAAAFDAVVNRLVSSGSTLTSIVGGQALSTDVSQQLTAVIADLDGALVDLRGAIMARAATPAPTPHPRSSYGVAGFGRRLPREHES